MKRPLPEAVIAAIAEREGVSESELREPLYDAIDPEALGQLFRGSQGYVKFRYHGYEVTVDHEGTVELVSVEDH